MSNQSCLLDLLAASCNGIDNLQRKNHREVFVNTNAASLAVGHFEEFDPSVGPSCQDGGERLHR